MTQPVDAFAGEPEELSLISGPILSKERMNTWKLSSELDKWEVVHNFTPKQENKI